MSLRPRQVNFQDTWRHVQLTANEIVSVKPVTNRNWSDCFSDIYSLCVSYPDCHLEQLYNSTCDLLIDHVTRLRRKLLQVEGQHLPQVYTDSWENYREGARYLNILYSYFNREFHNQNNLSTCDPSDIQPNSSVHLMEIYQLAMKLWKVEMVDHVISLVVQATLAEFNKECNWVVEMCWHIAPLTMSLVEIESEKSSPLQLYEDTLEAPLLSLFSAHCKQYSSQLLEQDDYSNYLLQAGAKLDEMRGVFSTSGVHPSTQAKLAAVCEEHLIRDHLGYLCSGVNTIMKNEVKSDLGNLCRLLCCVKGALHPLLTAFEEHVKSKGMAAVVDCLDRKQGDAGVNFVTTVVSMHAHYVNMVVEVFNGHCSFQCALDRACRMFVNMKQAPLLHSKAPFILSRYCDHAFRKGIRSTCDRDGNWINDATTVFKFIDDKDLFLKCYSKALAKRLIHRLSRSTEAEEDMILRLRRTCGCQYVCRLQRMLLDISLSDDDIMDKFATYLKSTDSKLDVSFSALVLQSGSWPLAAANPCIPMATELVIPLQMFEQFYKRQFSGKGLTWIMAASSGELRMTYLDKPYTVCAPAHHMSILLAFNSSLCHSISFLLEHTNLEEMELMKTIQLLLDNKLLLVNEENCVCVGDLTSSSQLVLNTNYSNKRTRFKVTSFDGHDAIQEVEQTQMQSGVDVDRKLILQAAVVRVMKGRRVLQHSALVQEVSSLSTLQFRPSVALIKSVIEALIEKQYMRRSDSSPTQYHYIA